MGTPKANTWMKVMTSRFGFLKRMKRDHLVFLICIVIAAVFWLLIKLTDVYTVTYTFQVKYEHVPVDKRLTRVLDSTLTADVTARGFALLDMGLNPERVPLVIDLNKFQLFRDQGSQYHIVTQELRRQLAQHLDVDESNVILSENQLGFELEKVSHKKIPVKAVYSIGYKEQYGAYDTIVLTPAMVEVYAPRTVLDTLSYLTTQRLVVNDVDADVEANLRLVNPMPALISFEDQPVKLTMDVERFTESSVTVPVQSAAGGHQLKTFPSNVEVYYRVAQKDFNDIKAAQFVVRPDVDGLQLEEVKKLPVHVVRAPDQVSNTRVVPSSVEFLILK